MVYSVEPDLSSNGVVINEYGKDKENHMYDALRANFSRWSWVPRQNLIVAASIWWSASWRTCLAIMGFMLVTIPLSPVLLYPFGMDVEQRFHLVRTLAVLLSVPIHIYFMARTFMVKQAGFKLVIQKADKDEIPPTLLK